MNQTVFNDPEKEHLFVVVVVFSIVHHWSGVGGSWYL